MKRELSLAALTAALAVTAFAPVAEAQSRNLRITRPDRWLVATAENSLTREETSRMLYLAGDGTMLVVQCASRDGDKTGGWAFTVTRRDWDFPTDFVEGWWSVDGEADQGPLQWGGSGQTLLLNEDGLRDRLQQPVESRIRLRVVGIERSWTIDFSPRDLAPSVERFAPSCRDG